MGNCCGAEAAPPDRHAGKAQATTTPPPPKPDVPVSQVFPDKVAVGGLRVCTSYASVPAASAGPAHHYKRLVVSQSTVFAGLFEAYGGPAAAQYCQRHCYELFKAASLPAEAGQSIQIDSALKRTLSQLDENFLQDPGAPLKDRMVTGCSGVLVHLDLKLRKCSVASIGLCSVLVGQQVGGFNRSTSYAVQLCAPPSHLEYSTNMQGFLTTIQTAMRGAPTPAGPKPGAAAASAAAPPTIAYSQSGKAPQAIGMGCGKSLELLSAFNATLGPAHTLPSMPDGAPSVGMQIQVATHVMRPGDEAVLLLSGSMAHALSGPDAVLLAHQFDVAQLTTMHCDKPPPLNWEAQAAGEIAGQDAVQLDSSTWQHSSTEGAASSGRAPFNLSNVLVQHALSRLQARQAGDASSAEGLRQGLATMVLAFEWPGSLAMGAADHFKMMAVASERRAMYHWLLLRRYHKFISQRKRHILARWYQVHEGLVASAAQAARTKEVAAWQRFGEAVQITKTGVTTRLDDTLSSDGVQLQDGRLSQPNKQGDTQRSPSTRSAIPAPPSSASPAAVRPSGGGNESVGGLPKGPSSRLPTPLGIPRVSSSGGGAPASNGAVADVQQPQPKGGVALGITPVEEDALVSPNASDLAAWADEAAQLLQQGPSTSAGGADAPVAAVTASPGRGSNPTGIPQVNGSTGGAAGSTGGARPSKIPVPGPPSPAAGAPLVVAAASASNAQGMVRAGSGRIPAPPGSNGGGPPSRTAAAVR